MTAWIVGFQHVADVRGELNSLSEIAADSAIVSITLWINYAAFEPYRRPGRYANFFSEDDEDAMREALGEENYERLMEIKATYDPNAVFSYSPNARAAAVSAPLLRRESS